MSNISRVLRLPTCSSGTRHALTLAWPPPAMAPSKLVAAAFFCHEYLPEERTTREPDRRALLRLSTRFPRQNDPRLRLVWLLLTLTSSSCSASL